MENSQRSSALEGRLPEIKGKLKFFQGYSITHSTFANCLQAGGFNAISVYHHWGLSEGKAGSLDYDYHRSQTELYEVAKEVGLLVVSRPGVSISDIDRAGSHY